MKYYINKIKESDFEETITLVKKALAKEGFGVLSEISISEKLKEKLGVNYPEYSILGACNPAFAYKALQGENKIGTMLPCNVVVRKIDKKTTEIAAIDPVISMMGVNNDKVIAVAREIREKLSNVIDAL